MYGSFCRDVHLLPETNSLMQNLTMLNRKNMHKKCFSISLLVLPRVNLGNPCLGLIPTSLVPTPISLHDKSMAWHVYATVNAQHILVQYQTLIIGLSSRQPYGCFLQCWYSKSLLLPIRMQRLPIIQAYPHVCIPENADSQQKNL